MAGEINVDTIAGTEQHAIGPYGVHVRVYVFLLPVFRNSASKEWD